MTAPTNSNARIATLKLEQLGFNQAIGWQQTVEGAFIARWRRGDLLATLILQGRRLTIALSDATDLSVPCKPPAGAREIAQRLHDAGVSAEFRPVEVQP